MVMRHIPPHDDPEPPNRQAAFRRTLSQALGRGLFAGVVAGVACVAALVAMIGVRHTAGAGGPPYPWLWILAGALLPPVAGAACGAVFGVHIGVDADDRGLHAVPRSVRLSGPWPRIVDVRAERRRSRTVVAVYLDSGAVLRLRAPYDGLLLGHDPGFERKMFLLLNVWETHRNWHSP